LGDEKGAERDWSHLQKLGFFATGEFEENLLVIAAYK
jgi:hypothetical protein